MRPSLELVEYTTVSPASYHRPVLGKAAHVFVLKLDDKSVMHHIDKTTTNTIIFSRHIGRKSVGKQTWELLDKMATEINHTKLS